MMFPMGSVQKTKSSVVEGGGQYKRGLGEQTYLPLIPGRKYTTATAAGDSCYFTWLHSQLGAPCLVRR